MAQRDAALRGIAALTTDLSFVMREELGISDWRERREARKLQKTSTYHEQAINLVDRWREAILVLRRS